MNISPDWGELPIELLETRIWPCLDSKSFISSISCCKTWYDASSASYSLSMFVASSSADKEVQLASLERVIQRHRELRSFSISNPNGFPPSLLWHLSQSSGSTLTKLAIPFCGMGRLEPEKWNFANWFPALMDLDLRSWKVPKSSITVNIFPPTLTSLSLSSCHTIVDESFENLSKLVTGLVHLDIRGIYRLTDKGVLYMLKSNPKITSLDISSLMNLTDASLIGACTFCPRMIDFEARGTKFTDAAIGQIPVAWGATLERLSMKMCLSISERGICLKLLPGLLKLKSLDLQKAELSPLSPILQSISDHCPQLTSLDLRDCAEWLMNEDDFSSFLQACSTLSTLYLRSPHVSDSHIELLARYGNRLVGLYMQECTKITPGGVIPLFQAIEDGRMPMLNRVILSDIPSLQNDDDIHALASRCKRVNVNFGLKTRGPSPTALFPPFLNHFPPQPPLIKCLSASTTHLRTPRGSKSPTWGFSPKF